MAATTEAQSISAPPSEKQIIVHDGKRYTTVREGLAYILVPEASEDEKSKSKDGQGVQQVFYNPIQQFNRDLTVLAIKAFGKERVAQKQVDGLSRFEKSAEKKRKRKEAIHGERSAKIPKTAEDAAAPADALADAPTNGSASASTAAASTDAPAPAPEPAPAQVDSEMPDADQAGQAEPSVSATAPTEENGAGGAAHTAPKPTKTVVQPFTILDALSASGLRALRYAHEIPFVTSVTSNDLLKAAVEAIKLNVQHNRLESKINVTHDDALAHMYSLIAKELRARDPRGRPVKSEKYDVVDLDPYGTAAPFLDAAVQSVRDDGGLLCVTCTDSGVWASNGYPEKCYSLYGGVPLKGWYSHEVGLRLILHAIETSAAKYGLAIEPLLSLSIDFYLRVFVRIRKSPARVKFQGGKNMIVYNCDSGCGAWSTQLLMRNKPSPNKKGSGIFYKHVMAQGPSVDKSCEHCGSTMHLAGPMYGGRIHSPAFVQSVLDELPEASTDIYGTTSRIRGMLQTAIEELMLSPEEIEAAEAQKNGEMDKDAEAAAREAQLAAVDPYPFYFHPAQLSGIIHCATPPEAPMRGALIRLGYRVTRSHTKPGSMKTDAPWSIIWHVMKEWARQKAPVKEKNINPGTIGYRILGLGEKQDDAAPAENGKEEEEEKKKKKKKQVEMPEVVFDEKLGQDLMKTKFVRYQMNPRENWGPMNRASGH